MDKELLDLILAGKGLITALTIAVIFWGVSKLLPNINRFIESWRKRKYPDTYVTYNDCIIEREFNRDKENKF